MSFTTPIKKFPLGDAITVICRVRRSCAQVGNEYDDSVEMICTILQDASSSKFTPSSSNNQGNSLPENSNINESSCNSSIASFETRDQQSQSELPSKSSKCGKLPPTGHALFFKPIPKPPSRTRLSSIPSHVNHRPTMLHNQLPPPHKKRYSSTPNALETDIGINIINSSDNNSLTHSGTLDLSNNSLLVADEFWGPATPRRLSTSLDSVTRDTRSTASTSKMKKSRTMKRKSLAAAAAACFAIDPSDGNLTDEDSEDNEFNDGTRSTPRKNQPLKPLQFLLKMNDVTQVEMVAEVSSSPPSSSKRKSTPPSAARTKKSSSHVHPHSFIVTITTAIQHTELTFYSRQSKDLLIAFLRSVLPRSVLRRKIISPSLRGLQLQRRTSGNKMAAARASYRSLNLMGTDSGSYVDMDNFEGMALKERFRNESFFDKMKRRCARLVIRAEEVCLCFDYDHFHEDMMKEVDRESTVNTSMISDVEFDLFDDQLFGDDDERTKIFDNEQIDKEQQDYLMELETERVLGVISKEVRTETHMRSEGPLNHDDDIDTVKHYYEDNEKCSLELEEDVQLINNAHMNVKNSIFVQ